ncbi:hypothetical protein ACFX13_007460 [Malus domestica]
MGKDSNVGLVVGGVVTSTDTANHELAAQLSSWCMKQAKCVFNNAYHAASHCIITFSYPNLRERRCAAASLFPLIQLDRQTPILNDFYSLFRFDFSGSDRLYTNENPSRSSLLTEGFHDDNNDNASHQLGPDESNPSDSHLPSSGPHANTNLAKAEACVGSNPSKHVEISVGDQHGESTVFVQARSIPRVMV